MSDLISRQAVENITWEEPSYSDPLNVLTEVRDKVRELPSADIMECARALKEHCNEHLRKPYSLCDDCLMFERVCRRFNVVPRWWDLPEGEKE